jgi:SAM-dependent methyltransferase
VQPNPITRVSGGVRAAEFWDQVFAQGQHAAYSRVEMPDADDPVFAAALGHFGDVRGKTVLDVGCGRGASALFFASHGAHVIAVDDSATAIDNLRGYCDAHDVGRVTPVHMSALGVATLGPVDHVFGSMILHHVEPFAEFAAALRAVLAPNGRGFFYENNARSGLLIWFRRNVVGRFGVPKLGDPDEFPLTPGEIEELRGHFEVRVAYPEFLFFQLVAPYLLRDRLRGPLRLLDRLCYAVPPLRRYSYRQYVYLS